MSTVATNAATHLPGQGTLRTPDGRILPLARTDVRARISGPIARVEVQQRFTNPTDQAIEAVYVFPLPAEASVHHMAFRIADRVVRGVIQSKEEARRTYERARREGRAATLLEQDQPSVFTLSVANVPPGATIDVELGYDEVLGYDDGEWRFVFPMVAPERYQEHPAASRDASAPRPPRVPSGERAGDVTIEVEVRAPGAIDSLVCPTHLTEIDPVDDGCRRVRLATAAAIPNRDFVLAFRAGGPGVRPTVRFERALRAPGTFLVMITPPSDLPPARSLGSGQMRALTCGNCGGAVTDISAIKEIAGLGPVVPCTFCGALLAPSADGPITRATRPRDVVVLVDRSASMRGTLAQARQAVRALLEELPAGDAVQVLAFDHERSAFDGDGSQLVAVAPEVIARVDAFLAGLSPRGGTELEAMLERVAKLPERSGRTTVVVLLSDLALGNEGRLLRRAPELLGPRRRLFVLGVGPAVERRLAVRLARACGGAADSLAVGEDAGPTVARFGRRVRAGGPVLTGLSLSWADARPTDVVPYPIPDLFGGQPVKLLGHFDSAGPSRLVLTGATVDGRPFRQEIDV
ncbi:MAG TPA: VIT domain-containing protein, partial [Haliangium sp.]|nr:VIT domain-containing protein [Haliangium sp.]